MPHYPALAAMGVTSIAQISRYTLQSTPTGDELKLYYNRPPESPLPRSKKFHFNGARKPGAAGGSELLRDAIDELNRLTRTGVNPTLCRQQLADELLHLEQVMLAKMSELRRQLADWR